MKWTDYTCNLSYVFFLVAAVVGISYCSCKPGFVWSGDKCVKEEDCGCIYRDGDFVFYYSVSIALLCFCCSFVWFMFAFVVGLFCFFVFLA